MRNAQVLLLKALDNSSQTSAALWVGQIFSASFIATFESADAAGTVKIQGSNDIPDGMPNQYIPASTSWADIPNATSTIASGAGPAIPIASLNFAYVRVVYTRSGGGSGSTHIDVNANIQGA